MELRIFDSNDVPLGFFSPGHENGMCPVWPAGAFRIRHRVRLPRMNRGEYVAQIELAECGVCSYATLDKSVVLRCEGTPTGTGLTFEYAKGSGWILLGGESQEEKAKQLTCNQVA
jgi:hypothetical protein